MRIFGMLAITATFTLAACGNADETKQEPDTADGAAARSANAARAVGGLDNDTSTEETGQDVLIPAKFQGQYDFASAGSCIDSRSFFWVGPSSYTYQGLEPRQIVEAKLLDANTLELKGAPDPDYPDADQRFGWTLTDNGQTLTVSAPQMSSMNYRRCSDKPLTQSAIASMRKAAGDGVPVEYRGRWSDAEYSPCSPGDIDAIVVEKDRIRFDGDAQTKLSNHKRIDNFNHSATGVYGYPGYEGEPFKITFRLRERGETLLLDMEGSGVGIYDTKCN